MSCLSDAGILSFRSLSYNFYFFFFNMINIQMWSLCSFFLQLSKKYGPVFTIHLGPQKVVVLYGYEAVKEALIDQADNFSGRGNLPLLKKLFEGTGMPLVMSACKAQAVSASGIQLRGQWWISFTSFIHKK